MVWTAGVKANPVVARFGLPLDERGRVRVGPTLQVAGLPNVWALGDCAGVPNAATPGRVDPPTSQHALRQARRLSANLMAAQDGRPLQSLPFPVTRTGRHPRPQGGIADMRGIRLSGLPGWLAARGVHLMQVPGASRRLGVVGDWILSLLFPGNIVTVAGLIDAPHSPVDPGRPLVAAVRLPSPGSRRRTG